MSPKLYVADLLSAEPAEPKAEPPAPPAPKKERSAKQIAAWEKAKATREAKAREAQALADEATRKAEEDAKVLRERLEALEAKKEARRAKRLAAKAETALGVQTPSESSAAEAVPQAPKRVRRAPAVHDPNEPPKWFKEYVHSVKAEKAQIANEPVPKRQLKRESAEQASELWREPQTRDRVNAEANDQMSRMYSTIFSGRRLY